MAYKHLFLDSDVLLDWLLKSEPFSSYTQTVINESLRQNFKVSTSTLVIANVNFILSNRTSVSNARQNIKKLVNLINILPFEGDIINLALNSAFTDFEDSIQFFIADKYNCDIIITRNIKDYKKSTIPVLTAEQFLQLL
ncbi:MAG TPA: VapC toxin family PIN domain ribonuclease [Mucilaginibacter sp.]|jgi:predicted nucleic acid-binding protein|nr:VapC toxin family PIN domain ribonuclease [Mucilaginibacter sp.]